MTTLARAPAIRWRVVVIAVPLAMLWLLDLVIRLSYDYKVVLVDGATYAAGARHLLEGAPLYAPFQLAGPYSLGEAANGLGFVYPPTAALLFLPLAPGTVALVLASALGFVALAVLSYAVAAQAGLARGSCVLLALFVACSGPAVDATVSVNANLVVAVGLLAVWLTGRTGYLAVLGGALKLYPAAGIVWALRRGEPLRGPLLLAAGLVGVTTLLVGPGAWLDFGRAFANGRSSGLLGASIPSPSQTLDGLGLAGGRLLGYGLSLAALAGAWRLRDERAAFALLGVAMILPAPDWWDHYLLVPLAAALPWLCSAISPGRSGGEAETRRPATTRTAPTA